MDQKVIEKFYKSIQKDPITNCWNWTGEIAKSKLPIIRLTLDGKFTEFSGRRVSIFLSNNKELIGNKHCLSICKNKQCVNPDHLLTGDAARFWSKTKTSDDSDCIIWASGKDKNGYGKFTYRDENQVKITVRANRYAFFLKTGTMPDENIFVCHTCDNPMCVNIEHLWLGTNQDNTTDRVLKGRGATKILAYQITDIRKLYFTDKKSIKDIAAIYSVTKFCISDIIKGVTWKHIK